MTVCTIRRGERGRNRFASIEPIGPRSLNLGQEDHSLGFNETIVFDDHSDLIDFALDIIGKMPAVALAKNERFLRLCRAVIAGSNALAKGEGIDQFSEKTAVARHTKVPS